MKRETNTEHPFFKKRKVTVQWSIKRGSLLVGQWRERIHKNEKIAAFDFDGTIAGVTGSYVYPKHGDDWKWVHPSIPKALAELHRNGWHIAILSNQKGILGDDTRAKNRKNAFMGRIANVLQALEAEMGEEIPVMIYASTQDDSYRKPRPGMWTALLEDLEKDGIDLKNSFYVGDAAGRPEHWISGHKKDFADTDFKFALNNNLNFFVPEQLFHSEAFQKNDHESAVEANQIPLKIADLPQIITPTHPSELLSVPTENKHKRTPSFSCQKMIILVGPPASGKSRYYKCVYEPKGYERINQDTLKTKDTCLKKAEEYLQKGKPLVIDNTNPDAQTRQKYIRLAKDKQIPVHCLYFDVPENICYHNNHFREFHEQDKKRVPDIAYRSYFSRFEMPRKEEGFDSIQCIEWQPNFNSEKDEQAWKLFYS